MTFTGKHCRLSMHIHHASAMQLLAARWFLVLGFITFVVPLCGCCGAAALLVRMKLKKKEQS